MSGAELGREGLAWLEELGRLRAQKRALEGAERDAVAQLRALAGGAEALTFEGRQVATDRATITRRIDPQLVRDNFPDAAEACTIETVARRFVVL